MNKLKHREEQNKKKPLQNGITKRLTKSYVCIKSPSLPIEFFWQFVYAFQDD